MPSSEIFRLFGISYNFDVLISSSLGECWANLNKDFNTTALYSKYGSSGNCFNMEHNDFGNRPKRCLSYTGKHDTNYIYRVRDNSRKSCYLFTETYLGVFQISMMQLLAKAANS